MSNVDFQEQIKELEQALQGWERLGDNFDTEFSHDGLRKIVRLARLFWLKNPLVRRGVNVAADYIWGRGVNINAPTPEVNEVVQRFLDDLNNQNELTTLQARIQKEVELSLDGNLFLVLFSHPVTGSVRVSSIPFEEIETILCDPENRGKPWYYKRTFSYDYWDLEAGVCIPKQKTVYYRDWRFQENNRNTIGGSEVIQDAVIYHIKVGGFSHWQFGVSTVYAAIDWARAYTEFLSNFASIIAALRRFAWRIKTSGGAQGVAKAKERVSTRLGTASAFDTNPAPVTGSTFVSSGDDTIEPVKTQGATPSADEGRPLKLMVAAAQGLPETFYGDADVGNHATARTLDRPTELGFLNRQSLWRDIHANIFQFVLFHAVSAVQGPLRAFGTITQNEYGESVLQFEEGFNAKVNIDFPALLERDIGVYVRAIVEALTLGGRSVAPYFQGDPKYVTRLLLNAIGETEIDEILEQLFPEDGDQIDVDDDSPVAEAARAIRESIKLVIAERARAV